VVGLEWFLGRVGVFRAGFCGGVMVVCMFARWVAEGSGYPPPPPVGVFWGEVEWMQWFSGGVRR
jgi:hypothetical protein